MPLCEEDLVVDRVISCAALVIVIIRWNQVVNARLPRRKIEHATRSKAGTSGRQLARTAVSLHNLIDCVVTARTPPRVFDDRDMFRLRDRRTQAVRGAKVLDVLMVVNYRVLAREGKSG